ncbi:hypothetical protein [Streptomyces sp. NPDC020742]|uniref:hypothetical protein n=1 Tax=Streptomyces sp. NPDC020742 TaxID=3154897 RepID=UPI0033DBBE07
MRFTATCTMACPVGHGRVSPCPITGHPNGASAELGYGAKPLALSDHAGPPRTLSLRETAGTMCDWLTRTRLPKSPSGKGWKVAAPTNVRAPITNCSLLDATTGKSAMDLTGCYGTGEDLSPQLPMSQVRSLLNAFAKDQAKRRGCTDLELPSTTIHPAAH